MPIIRSSAVMLVVLAITVSLGSATEETKKEMPSSCANGDIAIGDPIGLNEDQVMDHNGEILEDEEFTPWILYDSEWYPICGHWMWDNNAAATLFCKKLGFDAGVVNKRMNKFSKDAMPVGACGKGETDLTACTAGGNSFGDFSWGGGTCKVGHKIGIAVSCSGGSSSSHTTNSCKVPAVAEVSAAAESASFKECDEQKSFDINVCKSHMCTKCVLDFCMTSCQELQLDNPTCRCSEWPDSRATYSGGDFAGKGKSGDAGDYAKAASAFLSMEIEEDA